MEVAVYKHFFEKLKIVVKTPEKLNCSYGKISHDHKVEILARNI